MSARAMMTRRAEVERNTETGRDRNNQPKAPVWAALEERLPCFLWSDTERTVSGPNINALIEGLHLGVPLDADITPADRINGIYDRAGNVVDEHAFRILADQRMGNSHRELDLEVISGAPIEGGS